MHENNPPSSSASASAQIVNGDPDLQENTWECHICLHFANNPVATSCGHVFCWLCIWKWLRIGPRPCPLCHTLLNKDEHVLPLYCGGASAGPAEGSDNGSAAEVVAAPPGHIVPPRPDSPASFNFNARVSVPAVLEAEPELEEEQVEEEEEERGADPHLQGASVEDLMEVNRELRYQLAWEAARNEDETYRLRIEIEELEDRMVRMQQQLAAADRLLPHGWRDAIP